MRDRDRIVIFVVLGLLTALVQMQPQLMAMVSGRDAIIVVYLFFVIQEIIKYLSGIVERRSIA